MTRKKRRDTAGYMTISKVVPVRLPDETIARIDAHAARLHQLTGLSPSRSEIVKLLLERGLSAVEAEAAQHGRKR